VGTFLFGSRKWEAGPLPQPEFGSSFRALLPDWNNSLDYAEAEAVNSLCAKLTGICFGFAASCFANMKLDCGHCNLK
jgi:hypothetical protein